MNYLKESLINFKVSDSWKDLGGSSCSDIKVLDKRFICWI